MFIKCQRSSLLCISPSFFGICLRDPYHNNKINQLEKVQRRAARWVLNNFSHHSSVTVMLQHLQWPTFQFRRKVSRLQILLKIINQDYPLSVPPYFISMERSTRLYHPRCFILPNSSTYAHQNSFYPKTLRDWTIIELNNIDLFTKLLNVWF